MNRIKGIILIFLAASLLRIMLVLVIHYGLAADVRDRITPVDSRDHTAAFMILESWKNKTEHGLIRGMYPKYSYYMAAVMGLGGERPLAVPIANSLIGALMVFLIYDITKNLFNIRAAYISSIIYALSPSLVFWSSQNLKDIPCLFIVVLCVWLASKLIEPFHPLHLAALILIIPLLWALNELRNYIFIFLMYGVILYFLVNCAKNRTKNITYASIFFLIMSIFPQYAQAGILSTLPLIVHRIVVQRHYKPILVQIPRQAQEGFLSTMPLLVHDIATRTNFKERSAWIPILVQIPRYAQEGLLSTMPLLVHEIATRTSFKALSAWIPRFEYNIDYQDYNIGYKAHRGGHFIERYHYDIIYHIGVIDEIRRGGATGNTAFAQDVDISTPYKALKFLPKGISYFLFAPFPWSMKGLFGRLLLPEIIFWYGIFPFVLYGMYIYRDRWREAFAFLFFIAITLVAYSLLEGNIGTAFRHRSVLLPFFFIFAGAGIDFFGSQRKSRKDENDRSSF